MYLDSSISSPKSVLCAFSLCTELHCLPCSREGIKFTGNEKAPTGFALQNTTDDRTIQQNLVPLSPESPDAIFVPFMSRATKIGIMESDSEKKALALISFSCQLPSPRCGSQNMDLGV